jgi:hypothetical protein
MRFVFDFLFFWWIGNRQPVDAWLSFLPMRALPVIAVGISAVCIFTMFTSM